MHYGSNNNLKNGDQLFAAKFSIFEVSPGPLFFFFSSPALHSKAQSSNGS